MRRLPLLLIFVFVLCLAFIKPAFAADKNIFGLHLTQASDIDKVAPLVNSNGGDWGWVTLVIRTDQLDQRLWQEFFDKCRKLHIIPLIRLATVNNSGYWNRPTISDIDNLANFLNTLNWPTTKQHIILFNEINHGQEWGGEVDIKNFTDLSLYAIDKFKSLNTNFFILSPGLDLAAPSKPPNFESSANVYQQIFMYKSEYFDKIDALASHSYPNHGFIGTPSDTGQHSIKGYLWELSILKSFGVQKEFPVYITETGWPHREGESKDNRFYTAETASNFLVSALSIWQNDDQVVAVTPFIYNYPYPPFDHFSWVDKNEVIMPEYKKVIDLPKTINQPSQIFKYETIKIELPIFMFPEHEYSGKIFLKNTGQSIWGKNEYLFCQNPTASANIILDPICTDDIHTLPGQIKSFSFKFRLNQAAENSYIGWAGTPYYQIESILPIITNAQIYRPEIGILNRFTNYIQKTFQKIKPTPFD